MAYAPYPFPPRQPFEKLFGESQLDKADTPVSFFFRSFRSERPRRRPPTKPPPRVFLYLPFFFSSQTKYQVESSPLALKPRLPPHCRRLSTREALYAALLPPTPFPFHFFPAPQSFFETRIQKKRPDSQSRSPEAVHYRPLPQLP